ncbi:MAG TPA: hypothetical protein VFU43_13720 [Streptosporangiaceae bacterium]|nr:hypothetical protein [Streptosporangiaceae bacterium]
MAETPGERPPSAARRLLLTIGLALLGYLAGRLIGDVRIGQIVTAGPYFVAISALLAIGLYSSTHGIERSYLRGNVGTVVLAVTVGVFAKALLISALMFAFFREHPEYIVLGAVVAQIDPLSVAALEKSSRMTKQGKALLLAWASFDDPVTTLLTVYAVSIALAAGALGGADAARLADGGLGAFGTGLTWNLLLAGAVFLVWVVAFRRAGTPEVRGGPGTSGSARSTAGFIAQCVVLTAVAATAVWRFWMLAIALIGLFLRPRSARDPDAFPRLLGRVTTMAFALATVGLGLILVLDVRWLPGLVLGCVAFAAQMLAGFMLGRSQQPTDRVWLALAQQNGITAIVLALLLESGLPGTVAVVAPGVLVINVLHVVFNGAYEAWTRRAGATMRKDRKGPEVSPAPSRVSVASVVARSLTAPTALYAPPSDLYSSPAEERSRKKRPGPVRVAKRPANGR